MRMSARTILQLIHHMITQRREAGGSLTLSHVKAHTTNTDYHSVGNCNTQTATVTIYIHILTSIHSFLLFTPINPLRTLTNIRYTSAIHILFYLFYLYSNAMRRLVRV